MHRTCLLCLLLLLAAGFVKAQYYPGPTYYVLPKPIDTGKIYLRFNWMGLIDMMDGNVSVGGETRLNKRLSVTMDAGYIFYSVYFGKTSSATGVVLRPGVRLYVGEHKTVFFDLQFHYKGVKYNVKDWLEKDLVNNVATYEEHKTFQVRRRVYGGQVLMGGRLFPSGNTRLFMEIYWGLGVRYKEEWLYHEEPNSGYQGGGTRFSPRSILTTRKSTKVLPAMPFGIRLVYRIW